MTATEIFQLSNQIEGATSSPEILCYYILSVVFILGSIFLSIPLSSRNLNSNRSEGNRDSSSFLLFLFFFLLCCAVLSVLRGHYLEEELQSRTYIESKKKWEETYAMPYIKDLPFETRKVLSVKTLEEISAATIYIGGGRPYADGYTRSTAELHPLSIMYIDNTMEEKIDGDIEIARDAKVGESPYIEFQYLKEDLGFYWKKGFYNIVLHMHKNDERSYDFRN